MHRKASTSLIATAVGGSVFLLTSCGGSEAGSLATSSGAAQGAAGPAGSAGARGTLESTSPGAYSPAAPAPTGAAADTARPSALDIVGRQVISTAAVVLQVRVVDEAVTAVRGIAEGLDGNVEQLSSRGSGERQYATVVIRVPPSQFFAALAQIEALGEVINLSVGTEDVSEQFIDLEARLHSAQREEESLLKLLERTTTVTEILIVERELARVRADIERL